MHHPSVIRKESKHITLQELSTILTCTVPKNLEKFIDLLDRELMQPD
jgi:hypothetical protein